MIEVQCLKKGIIFHRRVGSEGFGIIRSKTGWRSIEKGPYERPLIIDPDDDKEKIPESLSKITKSNKKQYIADVKERIKRLMFGSDVTNHVRHLRLMDEFDKFAAKEGESLESVYERLTLVNLV
ncbi:hypothetical protein Tco_0921293 [Tanacetum coccineum]